MSVKLFINELQNTLTIEKDFSDKKIVLKSIFLIYPDDVTIHDYQQNNVQVGKTGIKVRR